MAQIVLQLRLWPAEPAAAFGEREAALSRRQCRRRVTFHVLAQLRHLHCRDDRGPARAARERLPGLDRLV